MGKFIFNINFIYFNSIDSTNNYLKQNYLYLKNWTIIYSEYQTNGKGYGNNNWISEKKKNLTFSILIKNLKIKIEKYFFINILVCNAIHKCLIKYYNSIYIKWPNDIIINDKKICGVLIENKIYKKNITTTIIGIGLNVNQINFINMPNNISSLRKILKKKLKIKNILNQIIFNIQIEFENYRIYKNYDILIKKYYIDNLYKKDLISFFKIKKTICKYIIKNILDNGKIVLLNTNKLKSNELNFFYHKEIKLIY